MGRPKTPSGCGDIALKTDRAVDRRVRAIRLTGHHWMPASVVGEHGLT
jgi:hypothetical protein